MTALTDAARPSATLHMNMAYTRSLRRWVAAAAVLLAAPIAADAQTEFHYQYGKLTNPFSRERAYTSIVTVQQASSWALGDSFVFVDILEDGGAFDIGRQSFWFTGRVEYIGATTNEMGDAVKGWILAQPQLGWDMGKAAPGSANQFFLGVEYQYWRNKLGVANDDNVAHSCE